MTCESSEVARTSAGEVRGLLVIQRQDHNNVMGIFDQDNVNTSLSHAEAYTYDNLNRLTNAVATGNSTYDLPFSYTADGSDGRYGNVTCVINGSTSGLCPTYNFNLANNQITNTGYTYDAAGNLTSDGVNSYQYDAEGRLRSAGLGGSTVSVVYNALGETVERSSTGGVAYRQENLYDPEGWELANYDGADGYWWGRNIALGNRNVALYFSNYVRFVHANNLGTTTAVTDQTGSLLQDQLYYPWGQQWTTAGSPQDLHFASLEQLEPDLGMYPTPHRRYTPTLGRWLTPDPGGVKAVDPADPQTWNMYAYAGNNPTTRTDPTGLWCCNDQDIADFLTGYFNALSSDFLVGAFRAHSENPAFRMGQNFGDATASIGGTAEALTGVGGAAAGTALDLTGAGALVGVPAQIISAGAVVQGSTAAGLGLMHLAKSASDKSGAQDKKLSDTEVRNLEENTGQNAHEIKAEALGTNKNLSKHDLYKTSIGNIVVKPKNSATEGNPTGYTVEHTQPCLKKDAGCEE